MAGSERSEVGRAGSGSMPRIILTAHLVDLPFTLLVPLVYVRMLGIAQPTDLSLVLLALLPLALAKEVLLLVALPWLLRPIARWRRSLPDGDVDGRLLKRACRVAYTAPRRFGVAFALAWGGIYFALTVMLRYPIPDLIPLAPRAMIAGGLFALSCFAAALPLTFGVLGGLLAPTVAELSLAAREHGVVIEGRDLTLRTRLVILGVCLTLAPTAWMAGMAYMALVPTATILLAAVVACAWGPLCAAVLSRALAVPIERLSMVVAAIGERGEIAPSKRSPIFSLDEMGGLAEGINEMVDRLDQSSRRIRDQAEVARRRASELQAVLDHMVEGVLVCDRQRLLLANRSATEMLGMPGVEEARDAWRDLPSRTRLRRPGGEPVELRDQPLGRALRGETVTDEEHIYWNARLECDRRARTSAAPIRDEEGAIVGAVQVSRDVTELGALERLKDQFVRVAAHELKTPVTVMKGYAQLVLELSDGVSPSQRAALEAINRGADRLDAIVRDLLDVSQLYLGRWKMASEEADLAEIARASASRIVAGARRNRIRLTHGDPAPVLGDRARLADVHARLLDNALKFSPGGEEVEVKIELHGGNVRVSIIDRGVGIPVEKASRIFEPFYRAHTDTPHDHGGIGAGLYICKEIIEHHGGTISFTSEEGRGSVFSYSLPLRRS